MLTELVVEYHKTQQRIKELESHKKALKAQIDIKLSAMGESRYEDSQFSAVMSESQRVRYDLDGLKELLMTKGLQSSLFTKEELDLKKVEALIASGLVNALEISKFAQVTPIKTLRVTKDES